MRKRWLLVAALVLVLLAVTFREGFLVTVLRLPAKITGIREG